MGFDYVEGLHVLLLGAIASGFVWVGLKIKGDKPTRKRTILALPFVGLGFVFLALIAVDMWANAIGGLLSW
jgi:hypothetical protein